jgi:hypothetical protein
VDKEASGGEIPIGSFVAELSATGAALVVGGVTLVVVGAVRDGGAAFANATIGMVVIAVVGMLVAPRVVRGSIENATPTKNGVESTLATCARGLWRATVVLVPLTATLLFAPVGAAGDGIAGGILLATGAMTALVAFLFVRWERQSHQLLLRRTRRWSWTDPDLERRWASGTTFAWPLLRAGSSAGNSAGNSFSRP